MNLGGTSAGENGAVPTTWKFTVTSPALVPGFQAAVSSGKRATVHYAQYAVAPVCNDTDYEATAVTTVP